ncbi:MAG: serine hydrolase [Chlorobi bacterium]|nr:serine hydrolase [Chlorobiota bacterium]
MKILHYFKTLPLFIICLSFVTSIQAQNFESEIDQLLEAKYKPNEPGATALVYKEGKVIYRKAFGSANLELDVAMQPKNVFEIGSITKQFTAISILMLEEQGKLKIEDEITKYISDYPTNGKTITIHHLLNHTSGIKSYTSMESFMKNARIDMTPTELIDVFKNEPMDFDPGEKFLYNNSGYILLGYIIEVVSGQTYADFIEKNIFEKLKMSNSYYGSMTKLIKNRASGYQDRNGYINAEYLSLTLPYAAGSLMSNVDDLLIWQKALNTYQLISQESYEKAIHGSTLNNGEHIDYGYGLSEGSINGSVSISHGGGIFGYTTQGIYLPNEDVFVSVLTNCDCNSPGGVANKIAALVIGKPFPDIKDAITLSKSELQKWIGAYQFEDGAVRFITVKDGKIFSQREGSTVFEIYPMSTDKFIFEDGNITYNFSEKEGKKQASFENGGNIAIGIESDKKSEPEKIAITLSPEILKQYVGKYELQPGFVITVTTKENQIFAQATGQPQFEIFAETEATFFFKVVPASIDFNKNDKDEIISLTLHQGGQNMEAKKMD